MFRTADGLGINHLYLCGITPTPENVRVVETSLGAENSVTWTHHNDGVAKAFQLKQRGMYLWALEEDDRSEIFNEALRDRDSPPIILVVGSEVCRVDPGILELCERTVQIPMIGIKRSFNVAVVFGIASHLLWYGG